jgi:AraC-like DNA-binding protein
MLTRGAAIVHSPYNVMQRLELDGRYYLSLTNYRLNNGNITRKFFAHHDLELSMVKQGNGVYVVDGRKYEIHKGDILIFNNIEPHYISEISGDAELVNMVVMFDPRFIWTIENDFFDSAYLSAFFNRNSVRGNRIEGNSREAEEICSHLLELEKEFEQKLPKYEIMIKVKLLNILALLARNMDCGTPYTADSSKRRQDLILLDKTVDYIGNNLSCEIRLNDLSGLVFMNPSYFSTFFKKYMGCNPSEYIAKKRINRAVEYLKASHKTVLEIAGLCGFNNTANFNKTFKRVTGRVPSDFRE